MKSYFDGKWLSLMGLNLILLCMLCIQKSPKQPQVQDLSNLESQIKIINTKLNQSAKPQDLSSINHNLEKLGEFIQQLKNKDDHQLGELFSTGQVALKNQLDSIADLLNKLNEQKHPIKILPASSLPFQILSIDSIQEISVASVTYDFKTQALELGDSLAGWTIVGLDFAKGFIEFENHDKAHVQLHLNKNGVQHD